MKYTTWILILFCTINGAFSFYMTVCYEDQNKKISEQTAIISELENKVEIYQRDVEVFSDVIINGRWE